METLRKCTRVALGSTQALLVAALAGPLPGQVTSRVSVAAGGAQGDSVSQHASISGDGRYVAFTSYATNLVAGDSNVFADVFVRDRHAGTTELVSISTGGVLGNGHSSLPTISPDGRYVAFTSGATNLVAGDTTIAFDVFVRDRQLGTTERVSLSTAGVQGDDSSHYPTISADGRYVAFTSAATNLVALDTNGSGDVFVRDRQLGTTERVSVDSGRAQANGTNGQPAISEDGRFVAFTSLATNLVAGDTNAVTDVFVRDRQLGTTARVSVDSAGVQGNDDSGPDAPAISADGRYVAFRSDASNLVAGDTNGAPDVFVRDRQSNTTERASVDSSAMQSNSSSLYPAITGDGRWVAFESFAGNLVAGDANGTWDVFVRDRQVGATIRLSVDSAGVEGNDDSDFPAISANGRFVAFESYATNLVSGDTNGFRDVFVHDRDYVPLASSCHPGTTGVIACPCANPPSGLGRGCNNSSATGGAILSASGVAVLSADTLVFTTSGEKPTATSIVAQWTGANPTGVIFGMGVRCTAGSLKRLFTKAAVGGSITAPNFGAGDPTVSVRSAALGDAIAPGQSRWYLVYYRDPIVLGGCPAISTFNATQTGEVVWLP